MTQNTSAPPPGMETMTQEQLDALAQLHERFLTGRLGGRRATLKNTNLKGLSLKGRDMRQANFMGCGMSHMDLSECNFQEASLYACDLSYSNLNRATFIRADLRGARIENASLEEANMEKADLRVGGFASGKEGYDKGQPVNFRGANLSGAKLGGTTASKADFSDAIMVGANMVGADLSGAQMGGADLSGVDVEGARLEGANLNSAILTGVAMKQLKNAGADVSEAITDENVGTSISDFEDPLPTLIEQHRAWVESAGQSGKQLDLSNVDMRVIGSLKMERLTAIKAINTKFFGMNLYKIQVQSAVLDLSDFRNCDLEESDMRGSSFMGANLSHARMRSADCSALLFGGGGGLKRFNPCNFKGATLRYTDLSGSKLKGANFQGADLSYADLTNADLREADFTGAQMARVKLDGAVTEGAIFDKKGKPVFQLKDTPE